jgi:hypothetical protein
MLRDPQNRHTLVPPPLFQNDTHFKRTCRGGRRRARGKGAHHRGRVAYGALRICTHTPPHAIAFLRAPLHTERTGDRRGRGSSARAQRRGLRRERRCNRCELRMEASGTHCAAHNTHARINTHTRSSRGLRCGRRVGGGLAQELRDARRLDANLRCAARVQTPTASRDFNPARPSFHTHPHGKHPNACELTQTRTPRTHQTKRTQTPQNHARTRTRRCHRAHGAHTQRPLRIFQCPPPVARLVSRKAITK